MIKIHQVVCEGIDLSGKTTLIQNIHKSSKFRWNIHDRGELSMLCYSRLYGRNDTDYWRNQLKDFLNNLNNRMIILHPNFDIIQERYLKRGDEIQDVDSLQKLYQIFKEEIELIKSYSTVKCITSHEVSEHTSYLVSWLDAIEVSSMNNVVQDVQTSVLATQYLECTPVNMTLTYNISELMSSANHIEGVFSCMSEEAYYHKITANVIDNINNELKGNNEYQLVQDINSRRFIYTDNSCISLIHSMVREGYLNVYVTCRSTHVITKFKHDLQFLYYLTGRVHRHLALHNDVPIKLHISLHSAHSF